MDRVLRGVGGTLRLVNYNQDGDPADAGGGNGTATVTDSGGTAAPGSPYTATRVAVGTYEVSLLTSVTTLDTYRIVWTMPDATTRRTAFELVGSFLFAVAELQALDEVLANETEFPVASIVEARENAEQRFAEVANVSFTRLGARVFRDGTGHLNAAGDGSLTTGIHQLASVVSARIDGSALSAPELAELLVYTHGTVVRPSAAFPVGSRNVELLVEHGYLAVPEPVRRAGLLYARSVLLRSALEQSDRATAVFTDIGGYRLTLAGRDGPTGLPEVDAVLAQFGRRPAGALA